MTDIITKLNDRINRDIAARHKAADRVAALDERIAATQAELAVAEKLQNVGEGTVVRYAFGRGETRREEVGTVIAVDISNGVRYKVQTGEGFDAKLTVIFQAQVLEVLSNV